MNVTPPQETSTRPAPAKLNLRLKITGRRPDGYHHLVSVMVPVALCDRIEIRPAPRPGISMTCQGLSVPENEENLAFRAAAAFCEGTGFDRGICIRLTKNIPVAAGMGGGSSDAAAVLQALNHMADMPLTDEGMDKLALCLGADVPFFLRHAPCVAMGIGERLTPIEKWPDLWYVIVMPSIQVSTAWVYGEMDRTEPKRTAHGSSELELTSTEYQDIINLLENDVPEIGSLMENDLERVTVGRFPEVARIKRELIHSGAAGALMSGSGPSVFGVYSSRDEAEKAKTAIAAQDLGAVFLAEGFDRTKWSATERVENTPKCEAGRFFHR